MTRAIKINNQYSTNLFVWTRVQLIQPTSQIILKLQVRFNLRIQLGVAGVKPILVICGAHLDVCVIILYDLRRKSQRVKLLILTINHGTVNL